MTFGRLRRKTKLCMMSATLEDQTATRQIHLSDIMTMLEERGKVLCDQSRLVIATVIYSIFSFMHCALVCKSVIGCPKIIKMI